jgi:hypothetical protein
MVREKYGKIKKGFGGIKQHYSQVFSFIVVFNPQNTYFGI